MAVVREDGILNGHITPSHARILLVHADAILIAVKRAVIYALCTQIFHSHAQCTLCNCHVPDCGF